MCRKPVRSSATRCSRKKLSLPAYDSSPRISAAHCSVDMALVPESVSRSIRMLRARIPKQVVSGFAKKALALLQRGVPEGLDALDAERLDDGLHTASFQATTARTRGAAIAS